MMTLIAFAVDAFTVDDADSFGIDSLPFQQYFHQRSLIHLSIFFHPGRYGADQFLH